jgi:hypothetical protein
MRVASLVATSVALLETWLPPLFPLHPNSFPVGHCGWGPFPPLAHFLAARLTHSRRGFVCEVP